MNKELKVRLICLCIGVIILGTGYFLSGEWGDEPHGKYEGYTPGEPIFEFDVIKSNCDAEGICRIPISSNVFLMFIGMPFFMASICPVRLTSEKKEMAK